MKHFDAIIIGTGQAGPSLAARFATRARQSPSWTGLNLVADAALYPAFARPIFTRLWNQSLRSWR